MNNIVHDADTNTDLLEQALLPVYLMNEDQEAKGPESQSVVIATAPPNFPIITLALDPKSLESLFNMPPEADIVRDLNNHVIQPIVVKLMQESLLFSAWRAPAKDSKTKKLINFLIFFRIHVSIA